MLRAELGLGPSLSLPVSIRRAADALCMAHEGPLLALVAKLRDDGVAPLRSRVLRLHAELGLGVEGAGGGMGSAPMARDARAQGVTLAKLVAAANAHLGVAVTPEAPPPLCKQVERLVELVGFKE